MSAQGHRCTSMSAHGYRRYVTYHPTSRFWAFQGIETGIFVVLAAVLLGVTFWALKRADDQQGSQRAVAALAVEHGVSSPIPPGTARPVSAWVAAMYPDTKAVASSPRPAANTLIARASRSRRVAFGPLHQDTALEAGARVPARRDKEHSPPASGPPLTR